MKTWPLALATLMIGATLGLSQALSGRAENAPTRPLAGLPRELGSRWTTARELPIGKRDLEVLQLSDYVSRAYTTRGAGGSSETALLYVAYYQSQRTGATYHSPLNCLPGSGWQITETSFVDIPGAPNLRVKRLVVEKELQKQVMLYWYHDRGRVITNEYAAKAFLIWDAMTLNRTDGALVRISVPVDTTTEAATETARAFLSDLWPALEEKLPAVARS